MYSKIKACLSKLLSHILVFHRRLEYTCENLTIHGPSFLVRKDIHFIYRLIYFIVYVWVWIGAIAIIVKYHSHYQQNTIRFTTRTDYLDWNTTFPSITICEVLNPDKIYALNEGLLFPHKLDIYHGEIAFFTGTCYSCSSVCERDLKCPTNFTEIKRIFRTTCKNLFINCKWNDEPINCCKHFKQIETEYGTCFSLNNKHALGKKTTYVASSKRRQMAALEIIATQDYEAFIHAPEDVPFWNQEYDRRIVVKFGSDAMVTFSIMDVVNEPEVSFISPEERQCRFSEELPENIVAYKYYSYSVCITECRIQAQLKICGCTHPQSPSVYQDRYCDIAGLMCLTKNSEQFHKLKVPGGNDTGVECDCLPSCIEPDYNVILKKVEGPKKELESRTAIFKLGNRPYQRVTRQVSRTTLDVVVAMGNSYSLFFGGSLLSVAEIIYYLCFRKWKYTKKN